MTHWISPQPRLEISGEPVGQGLSKDYFILPQIEENSATFGFAPFMSGVHTSAIFGTDLYSTTDVELYRVVHIAQSQLVP